MMKKAMKETVLIRLNMSNAIFDSLADFMKKILFRGDANKWKWVVKI